MSSMTNIYLNSIRNYETIKMVPFTPIKKEEEEEKKPEIKETK